MENFNEYLSGGKRYIKSIKKCVCQEKRNGDYLVRCRIHQRGEHEYVPSKEYDVLAKYQSKTLLYLEPSASSAVRDAVLDFEARAERLRASGICAPIGDAFCLYYRQTAPNQWEYLCSRPTDAKIYETSLFEMMHRVECCVEREECPALCMPTEESIARHPLYASSVQSGDAELQRRIKLYYRILPDEQVALLAESEGKPILPTLPEEFDRVYVVDAESVDWGLLMRSAYRILHRPNFAMRHSTRTKCRVNPHLKVCVDAADIDAVSVPFGEFLKLFPDTNHRLV